MPDRFHGGEISETDKKKKRKKALSKTVCFCQLRDAAHRSSEKGGERERAREGGGGGGKGEALSQAIKLNIELHSSSCLSMPLCLMLPPKQRIKGLECGEGKSQALSLPAHDICKSLSQKRDTPSSQRPSLHAMWLYSMFCLSGNT